MSLVSLFPDLADTVQRMASAGHVLFIVSHKTRTPYVGPAYDLHAAARDFLYTRGIVGDGLGQVPTGNVYFEPTKEGKVQRISELCCDAFIDDLPELLAMPGFPVALRRILFDPDNQHPAGDWHERPFETYGSWRDIGDALLRG